MSKLMRHAHIIHGYLRLCKIHINTSRTIYEEGLSSKLINTIC